MKFWLQPILLLFAFHSLAQPEHPRYFVAFNDKAGSRFVVEQPSAFLSVKSLERRQKQHIPVTVEDRPVSITYLQAVQAAGARVTWQSRPADGTPARGACDMASRNAGEGLNAPRAPSAPSAAALRASSRGQPAMARRRARVPSAIPSS